MRASFPFREAHLPSCALCVKTATDKATQGKTKNIHGIVGWDKSTKEESERMFFGCEDNLWLLNRFIARIHQRWWREGGDIRSAKISREAAHPLSELRKLGCRDRELSYRFLRHHAWEDEIWIFCSRKIEESGGTWKDFLSLGKCSFTFQQQFMVESCCQEPPSDQLKSISTSHQTEWYLREFCAKCF